MSIINQIYVSVNSDFFWIAQQNAIINSWQLGGPVDLSGPSPYKWMVIDLYYQTVSYTRKDPNLKDRSNLVAASWNDVDSNVTFVNKNPLPVVKIIDFRATPLTGDAPLTVIFTNLTTIPESDRYLWLFGDGTTSTDVNPTHVYQSGSNPIGYTASLQVSNSITLDPLGITIKNGYISASIPSVTSHFIFNTEFGNGPTENGCTASFTNTSTNTSQTKTTTYLWDFGDTNTTTSVSPVHIYLIGSFTASLQATGSYGISSLYTQSFDYFNIADSIPDPI